MTVFKLFPTGLALALGLMTTGMAQAQTTEKPAATNNQCWGQVASQLARSDSPFVTDDMHGGGMGMHSRSGTAADKNGGFANNDFAPIDQPRTGVGNVSKGAPHNTAPGDGGNGQHAVNNGEGFAQIADPVTGTLIPDGSGQTLNCDIEGVNQTVLP
jgi:hypothetical protein